VTLIARWQPSIQSEVLPDWTESHGAAKLAGFAEHPLLESFAGMPFALSVIERLTFKVRGRRSGGHLDWVYRSRVSKVKGSLPTMCA